ncbi:ATP-dependent DNA helicase RecQ [Pseudoalteromonas ulvae UL12]|uniref:RecQ family ATP-dependent DNA helicase n=1 Tax=Pseudoalteromonas ulvae TaxID=107327 RepID=UPI00186BACF9|nr:RecQ family ATP-dependent DNA helicase [Pseudoalteromonas ulvae]MBE0362537.1 ATP-dependent DNA helicase RecQ [Pseudoalteromonas ulvae UL12]
MTDLTTPLKQLFGFEHFRTGQQKTIDTLLAGRSALAIFPTGSGKSLCYQFTATQLPHLTLVVSPLLALMRDQLDFLNQKGIAAASLDSTLTPEQSKQIMADVKTGKIKILMVSVERFKNERFRQFLAEVTLSLLVVDEAHCISEWGHNFRPDYLKLPFYRESLGIPQVLLLTATATKKVKKDMAARFGIAESDIIQTGFYRPNLDLAVQAVTKQEKKPALLALIGKQMGCGIVYVTLQQTAQEVADYLNLQGLNAAAYHAGLPDEVRQRVQHDFMTDRIEIVIATIAFGMGVDKGNIRFVIHYDLPKSIENYSQEIGRAGRDGQPSTCITLANLDGINTVENFVYGDTPERQSIEFVIQSIHTQQEQGIWELQELTLSNASNIRLLALKTLLVQLELKGALTAQYAYYADFRLKFLQPKEVVLAQFDPTRQAFLNQVLAYTDFKKVWGTLDFKRLLQETGVERSRVVAALEYLHQQGAIELETKRITQVYKVNLAVLQDETLASQLTAYFEQKERSEINRIAALVRFFQLDRCLSHNLACYFDDYASPEQCGHCSVCRGLVAHLAYSSPQVWPQDEYLVSVLTALKGHCQSTHSVSLSIKAQTRFLIGMSTPIFTRLKVRQLEGFASCEQLRFADVEAKLKMLNV